jgi:WD40 repeat protein
LLYYRLLGQLLFLMCSGGHMRFVQILFFFIVAAGHALAAAQATLVVQNGQRYIHSMALSSDGRQIVIAGDRVAVLWDVATSSQIRVFSGHLGDVKAASFSPSGKLIVTASADQTARVWDAATGKQLHQFPCDWALSSAIFSPDGEKILTGDERGIVKLWDIASERIVLQVKVIDSSSATLPTSIAFSSDGRRFLTASRKTAQLWDTATGAEVRRFVGHTYPINAVAFSADGRLALTGSSDQTARVWEIATGTEVRKFDTDWSVLSVGFSLDGRRVITGSEHSNASVWDIDSGQRTLQLPTYNIGPKYDEHLRRTGFQETFGIKSSVVGVAFTGDGQSLFTCEQFDVARLWDARSGKPLAKFQGSASGTQQVPSLSISDDGMQIWTDGPREWDLKTGILAVQADPPSVYSPSPTALAHDGQTLLLAVESDLYLFNSADGKGLVQLTAKTGEMKSIGVGNQHLEVPYEPSKIANILISPDGSLAVTRGDGMYSGGDDFRLWSISMRKELRHFSVNNENSTPSGVASPWVRSVAFSPDSKQLLQAGEDRVTKLWDVSTGRLLNSFIQPTATQTHSAPTRSGLDFDAFYNRVESFAVGFSPDGNRILTGGGDGNVRIWDKASGRVLLRAGTGSSSPIENATFTPDGRHILVALENGFLVLDAASGQELYRTTDYSSPITALRFLPDGRRLVSAHSDGSLHLWTFDGNHVYAIATLLSLSSGGWAAIDPAGRFDTDSLDGNDALHWVVSDDPFRPLPLEVFMQQYYTPKLLARLFAENNLPSVPNIASINRVQPTVSQPIVEEEPNRSGMVRVRVKVTSQTDGKLSSGARDLRVFRDGRLVKFQAGALKNGEYTFDDIRLPHETESEFTAYAFNTDRVKSTTARTVWETKLQPSKPAPRAFLVNIGVNRNSGAGCELHYAASDATHLREILQSHLPSVSETLLVSDDQKPVGAAKQAIRNALTSIASQITPDDIFLLSFSGHGYTSPTGEFYLLPSDFNGSCDHLDQPGVLASAISSSELTQWLRPIDAGEMVMILDACYSAASVEAGGFKPGPMGSQGLGQLAYDKRIRILTASQSTQAATENPWIGMGLLSYSLVVDGLQGKQADWQPQDGKIWLREWLQYGVKRVPELYQSLRSGNRDGFRTAPRGGKAPPRSNDFEHTNLQTPVLFDFSSKDSEGPLLQ